MSKPKTARERTLELQGKKPKRTNPVLRFTIDGETIDCDVYSLSIRENWEAKAAAKEIAERWGIDEDDTHLINARTAWAVARRTHPELTLDDVIDAVTIGDLRDFNEGMTDAEGDDSPEA